MPKVEDPKQTQYGFEWGAAVVERLWSDTDGSVCIAIRGNTRSQAIDIYVSPKGRSVRAARGSKELK